jgi:hypothetical protein
LALQLCEEVLQEWTTAETLHEVRVAWARLGGRSAHPGYPLEHVESMSSRAAFSERVMESFQ